MAVLAVWWVVILIGFGKGVTFQGCCLGKNDFSDGGDNDDRERKEQEVELKDARNAGEEIR